jgi:hypothetical protein
VFVALVAMRKQFEETLQKGIRVTCTTGERCLNVSAAVHIRMFVAIAVDVSSYWSPSISLLCLVLTRACLFVDPMTLKFHCG